MPTTKELLNSSAAVTRTLGSDAINLFIPYHMDVVISNTPATNVVNALLSPGTGYKVYVASVVGNETNQAEEVLHFTTDNPPPAPTEDRFYGMPRDGYDFTLRDLDNMVVRIAMTTTIELIDSDGKDDNTCAWNDGCFYDKPHYQFFFTGSNEDHSLYIFRPSSSSIKSWPIRTVRVFTNQLKKMESSFVIQAP